MRWPFERCKHNRHCICVGDTFSYGHLASCTHNPLHPKWHRKTGN